MDIRQISYFISVAEYLSFTQAAKHHYVSQTAISQQIMALEEELGVRLFDRNSRSVRLTAGGKVFYNEAKNIAVEIEGAIYKTRQTLSGFEGSLTIGFQGPHEKRFLPDLIRRFRRSYPNIDVTLVQGNIEKLREALERRLVDIAFIVPFGIESVAGVRWKIVCREPMCAIVYRDHPLANEHRIRRSALANEDFVALDRREGQLVYDAMIRDCVNSGFSPKIVCHCRSLETVLFMVESGIGIAAFPRCFQIYGSHNIRFIDLEGEDEYIELAAAWRCDDSNSVVALFLSELQNTI